jgi:hypothetical protein
VAAARWAQRDLLAANAKADVRVFAVWFRMYPGDAESRWPAGLLTDSRVEHRWDEPKAAGRWFMENLRMLKPSRGGGRFPQRVDAMWDCYILFDRNATWKDVPSGILSWGYPIMKTRTQLQQDLEFAVRTRRSP